jgi:hypothetical protein
LSTEKNTAAVNALAPSVRQIWQSEMLFLRKDICMGKRLAINLEFYGRGRNKVPSVSFIEGRKDQGVPFTSSNPTKTESDAFAKFSEACHKFCKQLIDAGELV